MSIPRGALPARPWHLQQDDRKDEMTKAIHQSSKLSSQHGLSLCILERPNRASQTSVLQPCRYLFQPQPSYL